MLRYYNVSALRYHGRWEGMAQCYIQKNQGSPLSLIILYGTVEIEALARLGLYYGIDSRGLWIPAFMERTSRFSWPGKDSVNMIN